MERAVFLDRDGVIIEDKSYIGQIERVDFIPGVIESIKLLNKNNFKVIVITNQAGVARGYFTEDDVKQVHAYIQDYLRHRGAFIDEFYYCPHHSSIEKCLCRKPDSLLIEKAMSRFQVDPEKSWFIGNSESDIQAASKAGLNAIKIQTNEDFSVHPRIFREICP